MLVPASGMKERIGPAPSAIGTGPAVLLTDDLLWESVVAARKGEVRLPAASQLLRFPDRRLVDRPMHLLEPPTRGRQAALGAAVMPEGGGVADGEFELFVDDHLMPFVRNADHYVGRG